MNDHIEVRAKIRIPVNKVRNLITTAIEGGSNYWARFKSPEKWKENYKSIEDIPFKGDIEVFDIETDELLGILNLATINTGLQLMAEGKDLKGIIIPERYFDNLINDNADAETADVFMQLAVMGEIVYG